MKTSILALAFFAFSPSAFAGDAVQYPDQRPREKCGGGYTTHTFKIPIYGEQGIEKHSYTVECRTDAGNKWSEKKREGKVVNIGQYKYGVVGSCRIVDSKSNINQQVKFQKQAQVSQGLASETIVATLDAGIASVPVFTVSAAFDPEPRPGSMNITVDGGAPYIQQQNIIMQSVDCASVKKQIIQD